MVPAYGLIGAITRCLRRRSVFGVGSSTTAPFGRVVAPRFRFISERSGTTSPVSVEAGIWLGVCV